MRWSRYPKLESTNGVSNSALGRCRLNVMTVYGYARVSTRESGLDCSGRRADGARGSETPPAEAVFLGNLIVAAPPLILQRAFASRPSGGDGKPWTAVQASDPALGIKKAPLQVTIAGFEADAWGAGGLCPTHQHWPGSGSLWVRPRSMPLGHSAEHLRSITPPSQRRAWRNFGGVSAVLAGENKSLARHRKSSPLHRLAGGARNGRLKEGSTKPEVSIVDRVYVPNRRGATSAFRSARSVALKGRVEVSLSFCIR